MKVHQLANGHFGILFFQHNSQSAFSTDLTMKELPCLIILLMDGFWILNVITFNNKHNANIRFYAYFHTFSRMYKLGPLNWEYTTYVDILVFFCHSDFT